VLLQRRRSLTSQTPTPPHRPHICSLAVRDSSPPLPLPFAPALLVSRRLLFPSPSLTSICRRNCWVVDRSVEATCDCHRAASARVNRMRHQVCKRRHRRLDQRAYHTRHRHLRHRRGTITQPSLRLQLLYLHRRRLRPCRPTIHGSYFIHSSILMQAHPPSLLPLHLPPHPFLPSCSRRSPRSTHRIRDGLRRLRPSCTFCGYSRSSSTHSHMSVYQSRVEALHDDVGLSLDFTHSCGSVVVAVRFS
jgi:hypothetical protein